LFKLDEVVPSDPSLIDGIVANIMRRIEQAGCGEGLEGEGLENVDLALHEALANAIIHGNGSDPGKAVRIGVAVQPDGGMLVIVKDSGSGFDPDRLPNPLEGNLLAAHGRGIFLIKHLMDDVRFSFDHGTSIYMRRNPRQSRRAKTVA
jgi:anti-sigma regulatory factor (Ser/Thr protein kinase)